MTGVLLKGGCCGEACCLDDGTCENLLPEICIARGGTPQGCGTKCEDADIECEDSQACCSDDGNCSDLPPAECKALGGTPQGKGVICSELAECPVCVDGQCLANCPSSFLMTVSDITIENTAIPIICTALEPMSAVFDDVVPCGGEDGGVCAWFYREEGFQVPSSCGGGVNWSSGFAADVIENQCTCSLGGASNCDKWIIGIRLQCFCEGLGNIGIITFVWRKSSLDLCPPVGDWGVSAQDSGLVVGSARLKVA